MTEHFPKDDNEALASDWQAIGKDFDRVFKGIDDTLGRSTETVNRAIENADESPKKRRRRLGRAFLRGAGSVLDLSGSGRRSHRS